MTRRIETIPVQVVPTWRYDTPWTKPCRVLGRIRNLAVCWHPEAVNGQGELGTSYRARRRYCTVAVRAANGGGVYFPASPLMLTQWQALRLAVVLAKESIDWVFWSNMWNTGFAHEQGDTVSKWSKAAASMPDDQRRAEEKRKLFLEWIATATEERRDTYYLDLLELENFMGE